MSLVGIFYAGVFLIFFLIDVNQQLVKYFLCTVSCSFILLSISMIDDYSINSNVFTKTKYLGLVSHRVDLNDLVDLKIISLSFGSCKNPFTILLFSTSDPTYFKSRKVTLHFSDGSSLTIYERAVQDADFKILLKKLKSYIS
jgi:hypothetical protein